VHGNCKIVIRISDYYWAKDGTMKKAATTHNTDRVTMHLLYISFIIIMLSFIHVLYACMCGMQTDIVELTLCMCVHVRRS